MVREDYDGKMLQRAVLVTQREEIEDLVRSLRTYFDQAEIQYFMNTPQQNHSVHHYLEIKRHCLLREACSRIQGKIIKKQDLEASVMSEGEVASNVQVEKQLEEIDSALAKNIPIYTEEEIIETLEAIA